MVLSVANNAKNLKISTAPTVGDFFFTCGQMLYQQEAVNSLMLGLLEGMKAPPYEVSPLLVQITEGQQVVSAAVSFRKQPVNLILTFASEAQLQSLAHYLWNTKEFFSGVLGPRDEAELFVKIWKNLTGQNFRLGMGQKIYQINQVHFPKPMDGEMKVASLNELDTVFSWIKAFAEESLPADPRADEQWMTYAQNVIQKQGVHLWCVQNRIVSMASAGRPTQNGISISGVYTPPKDRKKGFASCLVANVSQKYLFSGKKFCILYTDILNSTSNKIYQELGYQEICESRHFRVDSAK